MRCRVSHSSSLNIETTRGLNLLIVLIVIHRSVESALLASARCRGALVHFVRRHILYVGCNVPLVSEGILKTARPVAVELILHRPYHLRTGSDSQLGLCIHVLDVEKDTYL